MTDYKTRNSDPAELGASSGGDHVRDAAGGRVAAIWHVRKEDVRRDSATVANPPFASFDVVLRRDHEASLNAIHALTLDDSLSHVERLLAIERMTRVRP